MNPNLDLLHPYPFQRLSELFKDITPNAAYAPINLAIGEPQHETPDFIKAALAANAAAIARYPATKGLAELRTALQNWLRQRYAVEIDSDTQILPVNGSREALFALAQAVISPHDAIVIMPNPFYQIYEGAALLAGATPYFINTVGSKDYRMDFSGVAESIWQRTQLVYVCTPGNPTGKIMSLSEWAELFELADRYNFVVASDECYSEIYFDESHPPLGALAAGTALGRANFAKLIVLGSLSKRSNVPGLRSGFAAGDTSIISKFLAYRTYHGSAMSLPVQAASVAAWRDETHVIENRRRYKQIFSAVIRQLGEAIPVMMPEAAFYLWLNTGSSDIEFAKALYRDYNVQVLPGRFLAREAHGINPGQDFIRVALVASEAQCVDAAERIKSQILKKVL